MGPLYLKDAAMVHGAKKEAKTSVKAFGPGNAKLAPVAAAAGRRAGGKKP